MTAFRLSVLGLFLATATVAAADQPLEQLIDAGIDAKLKADAVVPAGQASDFTLVRRLTLDLIGRVPTFQEVDAYTSSSDPDKRAKLVDRLMASPGYARYQGLQFEVMLGDRQGGGGGKGGTLREYLTKAVQENRPWDRVFRELMLPDDTDPATKGASDYLRPKLADLDKMTADVSSAFFGVNVSCAQCHDHPHVPDWTQEHFYGMKSFLARTFDAGGTVAEREAGQVKYKPTKGAEKTARLMFITGTAVATDTLRDPTKDEQKAEKELTEKLKADKKAVAAPKPKFSARAELVKLALQPKESEYFSKAIANRLWHRFLGFGLVMPLDQLHSKNPPSHPDLLAALAADTAAHGYDLKRLVRGIVMSKAYSRASVYDGGSFPSASAFAVAPTRPLTPMQLAASLRIAVTDPKGFDGLKPDEFEKRMEQNDGAARGFASLLPPQSDAAQIGVSEALLFTNGDRVAKEYLGDGGGTLLARLKAEKDTTAAIRLLVRTVLGRPANDEELKAFGEYAARRTDRPAEAYRQMLWALVTSPEFRFNH